MKDLRIGNGIIVNVEDDVYREYYRHKEREAYLQKRSREHESSIEYFQIHGVNFENHLSNHLPSTEEVYFEKLKHIALNHAIRMLPLDEQYIIIGSFYLGKQGNEIAREMGVSPGTITKRKKKILRKLLHMLTEA